MSSLDDLLHDEGVVVAGQFTSDGKPGSVSQWRDVDA